jgi:hydroxyacylglutathione hydrolase
MPLPLEDNFNDIVGKAMRGLKLDDRAVAMRTGVSAEAVEALREGTWDEATARAVAPLLAVNADALATSARKGWQPEPIALDGLAQFNTPYDDMTVNSYLAWDAASGSAVAFDSGADCTEMLELLAAKKLELKLILLTHTHGDHIFDLDRLKSKTGAPAFVSEREPLEGAEPFPAGRSFDAGSLHISTRLTWGHSSGGITFVVHGLARPVAIVGDSIFAGSMGGGGIDYQAALKNNREQILTLSTETILCPGHGPLTTVANEKRHNPFFA